MLGAEVTAIDVWRDRHVAIVEPLANLQAYDARPLVDALREAEKLTQVSVVIVQLDAALLVDVEALDALLSENRAYAERGGRLVLACPSTSVLRLMELSGVANLLQTYPSLEDALRELSPS